ncbi:MAG: transcriptional regulator, MarR family [Devosia sp.]|nr:transcriptional regulator, MarR family [Devosia sp.]
MIIDPPQLAQCLSEPDARMTELAKSHGMSPASATAIARIDEIMGRIRRGISKREFGREVIRQIDPSLDVGHLDAMFAIAMPSTGHGDAEVTVGLVAVRLGLDPSRASRLTSEIVEKGYARRVASQSDARRIGLELTEQGHEFARVVRETKLRMFNTALHGWREDELVIFAELLDRFSTWTRPEPPKSTDPTA